MDNTRGEIELLQGSVAGNKEAFGTVVQQYQSLVCAVTYSATGDVGTSEELAQETFIRAWRNLSQLDDLRKFRVWLCQIARNLTRTWLRGRRKGPVQPLEGAGELAAVEPRPDEAAVAKERQEIVWAAVERIPSQYREPLVLFYRSQRSVSEVAADLDLSEDIVRQRLHRGRRLIKAEVSSLVEDTLARSGPGKAFTVAVIAALPVAITAPASAAVVGITAKAAPVGKTLLGTGLTVVVLGPILGLLGGIFGAWASFKSPDSPRQRRFRIRLFIAWWLLFFAGLGLPLTLFHGGLISAWALGLCLAVYVVLLMTLIVWMKVGQRRILIEDEHLPAGINRQSLHGGIGGGVLGGILGATGGLLYQDVLAKDWLSFVLILAFDILMFCVITRAIIRIWTRKLQHGRTVAPK
jgi:RNA polymerase sigma factor (sigma-70 family)